MGEPVRNTRYEIRIRGVLSDAQLDTLRGLSPEVLGGETVLRGVLDQSALYGVLAQIEALGIELLEVRRTSD
jgi:hypothetical protein